MAQAELQAELKVGKNFVSADEMDTFFKTYEIKEKKEVSKYNTCLLDSENSLKYHSLTIKCAGFGQYETRGKTDRRKKPSKKCNCAFQIKIGLNSEKTCLEIKKNSCFTHNSDCDKQSESGIYTKHEKKRKANTNKNVMKVAADDTERAVDIAQEIVEEFQAEETTDAIKGNNDEEPKDKNEEIQMMDKSIKDCTGENDAENQGSEVTKSLDDLCDSLKGTPVEEVEKVSTHNLECESNAANQDSEFASSLDDLCDSLKETLVEEVDKVSPQDLEWETIENESEIVDVVFADIEKKCKGRPKNTTTKKTSGAPITPVLCPFQEKSKSAQAKILLKFIMKEDKFRLMNVLDGSAPIEVKEISHLNKKNLKDTFIDDCVDVNYILKYYLTDQALNFLNNLIKKKDKTLFTCNVCNLEASDESEDLVGCEMCLLWYHCSCVNVTLRQVKKTKNWYCKLYCDI